VIVTVTGDAVMLALRAYVAAPYQLRIEVADSITVRSLAQEIERAFAAQFRFPALKVFALQDPNHNVCSRIPIPIPIPSLPLSLFI
jgi:hypothetical protein